jgi:hypothetical protein
MSDAYIFFEERLQQLPGVLHASTGTDQFGRTVFHVDVTAEGLPYLPKTLVVGDLKSASGATREAAVYAHIVSAPVTIKEATQTVAAAMYRLLTPEAPTRFVLLLRMSLGIDSDELVSRYFSGENDQIAADVTHLLGHANGDMLTVRLTSLLARATVGDIIRLKETQSSRPPTYLFVTDSTHSELSLEWKIAHEPVIHASRGSRSVMAAQSDSPVVPLPQNKD